MASDNTAFIHQVATFRERNLLADQYEGMLVEVLFDPAYNDPNHPDDVQANPTGKVYRLKPLAECDLRTNNWGDDNAHWEIRANGDLTGLSAGIPTRIDGGVPNENCFAPSERHPGPWLTQY